MVIFQGVFQVFLVETKKSKKIKENWFVPPFCEKVKDSTETFCFCWGGRRRVKGLR